MLFNVPNTITFGRVILIPVLVVLMAFVNPSLGIQANYWLCFWAMIIFTIAGVSDLVDGYYARKYGAVSNMGKFIDPMADKLIHMAAMIMLIPVGRLAAWVVVVLLFREIFVTGIRAVAAAEGIVIDAAQWGKYKTAWLNVGIGAMLFYYPAFPGTAFEVDVYLIGIICLAVGAFFSIVSGVQYTIRFIKIVNK